MTTINFTVPNIKCSFTIKNLVMKNLFLLVTLSLSQFGFTQNNSDTLLIRQTIDTFFEGMKQGDSTIIRTTLHPSIRMLTCTKDEQKNEILRTESVHDFLIAVASPHEDVWNEKLTSFSVLIDQNMAQVWTNYSFYINDTFSHCGVNAFDLFKDSNGWRIVQIVDTRRRKPCND